MTVATFVKDDSLSKYLLLAESLRSRQVSFNGETPVEIKFSDTLIQFDEVPNSVEIVQFYNQPDYWKSKYLVNEVYLTMNSDERLLTVSELTKNAEYDEYTGRYIFKNLEDEVRYERYLRDWELVYRSEEARTPVEIEIINIPISEYECIEPVRSVKAEELRKGLVYYTPNLWKWFTETCHKHGIVSRHAWSGDRNQLYYHTSDSREGKEIDFIQISNSYVWFSDDPDIRRLTQKHAWPMTYEAAIDRMKQDKATIEKGIVRMIEKFFPTPANGTTLEDVRQFVNSVQRYVKELDYKVKDKITYNVLTKTISEFSNKIEQKITETHVSK